MAATEYVLDIPPLDTGPAEGGGVWFAAAADRRSFRGTLRRLPGRLIYTRSIGGFRAASGWTAVATEAEVEDRVMDLLLWVATGKMP